MRAGACWSGGDGCRRKYPFFDFVGKTDAEGVGNDTERERERERRGEREERKRRKRSERNWKAASIGFCL
jgi:hypothetical protein